MARGGRALDARGSARGAAPRPPPRSEAELLARADALAGRTLGELADALGVAAGADGARTKGLAGRLLELHLGADAGSAAAPDFVALGVELKSIPLDAAGRPRESTFVCSIDLHTIAETDWEHSRAREKLARVLWVPIESNSQLPWAARRIGRALLWSPSAQDEAELRADFELLAGLLGRGDAELVTAHLGRHLQIRPKAASAAVRRPARDAGGALTRAAPAGFYLRARYTARLFCPPAPPERP